MRVWDDLAARARGLSGRLLDRRLLEELGGARDLDGLASGLGRTTYAAHLPAARPSPAGMESGLRARVAGDLAILDRWGGPERRRPLAPVFEDLDRRSLRVLIRGAVAGAPSESRLRGTLATPGLPEDRLIRAARTSSLRVLAELLEGWDHPLAPALGPSPGRLGPDLFRIEAELSRVWADRAAEAAEGAEEDLETFVRETIDEENVRTVLARVGAPAGDREVPFLDGGRWLGSGRFHEALGSAGPEAAAARLRDAFREGPFRGEPASGEGGTWEERVLARRVEELMGRSRLRPTGPAPVLLFILRLRRELQGLRRAIWGLALGAPPGARLFREAAS